jgi:hypothetical protein
MFKLILMIILSYPLSHVLMKKSMLLDLNFNENKFNTLKFFYKIPIINVIIIFSHLLWVIVFFKR